MMNISLQTLTSFNIELRYTNRYKKHVLEVHIYRMMKNATIVKIMKLNQLLDEEECYGNDSDEDELVKEFAWSYGSISK